ncbi:SDR family NAD(P)-dependent oxidoreductase [Companilactobacillus kimchiensis]|uniref:Short-chain dehydrogenase oxidoreductase n=1 Tax=Companilactobacillus kimchiensis TaxID=993692 RepID=A0A0R2LQG0_9LACO|nr:SDR family oxidoreductase [Companilactobacillus kimchiensis]KRO00602.1 short-chain dehydrogenase oxidoreductase [Companilactobacillus kimchiensis]
MENFTGKVVIVTGARTGIGLSAATLFAKAGASVVLAGRHEPKKEAEELVQQGYKAASFQCDVSNETDVKNMVDFTVKKFGHLDFAYNNAGIQSPATKTEDLSLDEYNQVLDINLKGVFLSMKYELKQMSKQGSKGAIVNCSSMGGLVGIAGRSAYHASKHGVLGMTKSSALEYAQDGIRINAVCPGIIHTPMVDRMDSTEKDAMDDLIKEIPIGRLAHPEEVAKVVLFLCSDDASYIIGQGISVDGGYTIH